MEAAKSIQREINPFEDEYIKEELSFYGRHEYNKDGLEVIYRTIQGRVDDYLNHNYRCEGPEIPILLIDGKIWMSLSYMEVQSMYLPITRAEGTVGTAGLGLGYAALAMAASGSVDEVHVWETDERVIEFFNTTFKDREEFKKIKIHHEDARTGIKGYSFDFFLLDIYQTLLPDEVVSDIELFLSNNDIRSLHWWGQEKVLLYGINEGLEPSLEFDERWYFRKWYQAKVGEVFLHNLPVDMMDSEFAENCLAAMNRI